MAPFDLTTLNSWVYALVFGGIGLGFGAVLEMAGFGDSRKLAAQFYFREMTVLKVMFTAIIVACVLIYLSSAFGLLDFNRIWVNPTYLASGIVGGLIMGVGFIIGGFCPGTSLVAASTLKVDGIFFVLGALIGVYAFGESLSSFESFYLATYLGRFTIADWLGIPAGVAVALVVLMALLMFWGAEIAEAHFGGKLSWSEINLFPSSKSKIIASACLVFASLVLIGKGQPTPQQRWSVMAAAVNPLIERRAIFVHPAEVVDLKKDTSLSIRILDLRPEPDYNLFHIADSQRIEPTEVYGRPLVKKLVDFPDNTISFLVSNGERKALSAWKVLKAQGIANIYIIEGGINGWLDHYPLPSCVAQKRKLGNISDDQDPLRYAFSYAIGSRAPSAHPHLEFAVDLDPCQLSGAARSVASETALQAPGHRVYPYTKKVILQKKRAVKGGCG
jgi:rhodanese-related sulfurtransferase